MPGKNIQKGEASGKSRDQKQTLETMPNQKESEVNYIHTIHDNIQNEKNHDKSKDSIIVDLKG
jgi:hypothetical protein